MKFELRLREAGLPQQPVRQLTSLFEKVRYGAKRRVQKSRNWR